MDRLTVPLLFMLSTICLGSSCWGINDEGLSLLRFRERIENDPFGALNSWNGEDIDPCFWSGVECSNGIVVALKLADLCLEGTLAPEIGNLLHIKSIILRNNTFSGTVPQEFGELKDLEVLDLGYNNLSEPLPYSLENNSSISTILLDNNERLISGLSEITSQSQVSDQSLIIYAKTVSMQRMLLENNGEPAGNEPPSAPAQGPESNVKPPPPPASTPHTPPPPPPSPPPLSATSNKSISKKSNTGMVVGVAVGVSALLFFLIILGVYYRRNQISVKPLLTSFSGHMQKPFVPRVPKMNRSELVAACEDFSNLVGSSSIGTIYKGTLSNGAEIAVATVAIKSIDEWSTDLEAQFRKKIERLAKVNHKNFLNLVGYCEEDEPFTRMLVFEYAPNGTLLEHLHVKDAEPLDWAMRLRIAMGVAYSLQHMHQLNPPLPHGNLNSSAIMLTEDYAAKVSSFIFWNQISAAEIETNNTNPIDLLPDNSTTGPERNVYSFGVVLFELITARLPYSVDNGSVDDWASDYVSVEKSLKNMVDPSLTEFDVDQVEQVGRVIKYCVHPSPDHRPTMAEVCERLRVITGILPDGAATKLPSLWWEELEIISTEGA